MSGDLKKLTRSERLFYRFFMDAWQQLDWDLRHNIWAQRIVPSEWHEVLKHEPTGGRTRVTLRLDADLVKFFRKMGPGYQTQINRILRAFVKAKMAGFVNGPGNMEEMTLGLSERDDLRPQIGDFERIMDEMYERERGKGREAGPEAPG